MTTIWFKEDFSIDKLQHTSAGTMSDFIGVRFTEIGPNFIKATMPVNERTKQPFGLLHGGASVVLAETLGSVASALVLNMERSICVGLEINANHIRSVQSGLVTGTVTPIHLGSTTHVWDIRIQDENDKLVCVSRLTVAVLTRRSKD